MTLVGQYVDTFAEASHALPNGMHMNADYPFVLPRIVGIDDKAVTIEGRGGARATFVIKHTENGERGYIEQSSSFESIFSRKPTRFELCPFKDDRTPRAVPAQETYRAASSSQVQP